MPGPFARSAAALALVSCAGCISFTDPLGREDALEQAQLKYTQFVRWGELERARQYVHPDVVEEFNDHASAFEGLRITEYDIGPIEYAEEPTSASVNVTYHGYSETTFLEKPIRERQEWSREGMSNQWLVRPELGEIVETLAERHPARP